MWQVEKVSNWICCFNASMLSGKEFLGFCQKLSSIIWRSWLFEFPHFFLSGFFLPAVISWLYFITFWDLAFKHLEMYLFSQCKKQTTTTKLLEFWRTLLIIWHCTVNILCASKNLLLSTGLPSSSLCRQCLYFPFYFLSQCIFLTFLSYLSFSTFSFLSFLPSPLLCPLFSPLLPSSFLSFFFFHSNLKAPNNLLKSSIFVKKGFQETKFIPCTRFWTE